MSTQTFRTPEGVEVVYSAETLVLRKIRRWTYRGEDFAECWLEDANGVEHQWGDTPLGLSGREGHVYSVLWASIKGRTNLGVVGAINLTSKRYKLSADDGSPVLSSLFPDRWFGRLCFILAFFASVAAALYWPAALRQLPWLQPWHAVAFPFAAGVVGCLVSIIAKPRVDPTLSFNEEVKRVLFEQSIPPGMEQPARHRRRGAKRNSVEHMAQA